MIWRLSSFAYRQRGQLGLFSSFVERRANAPIYKYGKEASDGIQRGRADSSGRAQLPGKGCAARRHPADSRGGMADRQRYGRLGQPLEEWGVIRCYLQGTLAVQKQTWRSSRTKPGRTRHSFGRKRVAPATPACRLWRKTLRW